jgi:hypothetical protein
MENKRQAAHKWVFEINECKWSNNDDTAGDNYGSFIAGVDWLSKRTYTENEVSKLLETQRGNCYVAILDKTNNVELASIANNAPEPRNWKKMNYNKPKEKPNKEDFLKTLKDIAENCPKAIIGGSVCFVSRSLLDREPYDIDILISVNESINSIGIKNFESSVIGSDSVTDINGELIQRTSIKINGINVCVFKVNDNYLDYDEVLYEGILIKSQNPYYGIEAKKIYSKFNNPKHNDDLNEIIKNFNKIKNK